MDIHTGFYFYRGSSGWNFISDSLVNVFSKRARFQHLELIPSYRRDMYGWTLTQVFFLSLIFRLEIYTQFYSQRFLETREVSGPGTNSIEQRGPVSVANHKGFVNFHAGNLCPILWSTFSRNRRGFRTWDQFHRTEVARKGGQS